MATKVNPNAIDNKDCKYKYLVITDDKKVREYLMNTYLYCSYQAQNITLLSDNRNFDEFTRFLREKFPSSSSQLVELNKINFI